MDGPHLDIARFLHFSPVCCCGGKKISGKVFCDECWENLSQKLREDWCDLVLRTRSQMRPGQKSIAAAPAEALTVLKMALRYLDLEMPKVNCHGNLKITVKGAK